MELKKIGRQGEKLNHTVGDTQDGESLEDVKQVHNNFVERGRINMVQRQDANAETYYALQQSRAQPKNLADPEEFSEDDLDRYGGDVNGH